MRKSEIILSPDHPSLLEEVVGSVEIYAPVVVNHECMLVDGYRRYLAAPGEEIESVCLDLPDVFLAAFQMNRNTRTWDDVDCFLWNRWAQSLNVQDSHLPKDNFPVSLNQASPLILNALARRKLLFPQAVRILQAPPRTWPFFVEFLSSKIQLNGNETANFLDMTFDLANRAGTKKFSEVFEEDTLQNILFDPALTRKQKGDHLLKAMRSLRYPLYEGKTEELSSAWEELKLRKWQAKKDLLLEKGVLELTIRARSQEDLSRQVQELFDSVNSPVWNRIWEI